MADFKINRVYTRSGDSGETALVGGKRVSKSHPRIESFGAIDELNAVLGCAKEQLGEKTDALRSVVEDLQQQLFDLGSELATDPKDAYEGMWQAEERHIKALEELCDSYGENLPELDSFILPGGSLLAASLHLARTVARRAEREIVRLREAEGQDAASDFVIQYVNRIGDLMFVLARWALVQEQKDAPLWVLEKDRSERN